MILLYLNVKCYINSIETDYEQIYIDNKYVVLKILINENLKNNIKSWKYLREESKNYFTIDFSKIGERISIPNTLEILGMSHYKTMITFDNIDKYINNINYSFEKDVLNSNEIKNIKSLQDWVTNE